MTRPVRTEDARAYPLDDGLVLYEPVAGTVFLLNRTGVEIWSLCDGTRTGREIARHLATAYGIDPREAVGDVEELLVNLAGAGLLVQG